MASKGKGHAKRARLNRGGNKVVFAPARAPRPGVPRAARGPFRRLLEHVLDCLGGENGMAISRTLTDDKGAPVAHIILSVGKAARETTESLAAFHNARVTAESTTAGMTPPPKPPPPPEPPPPTEPEPPPEKMN